jgi:hypothetical protein
MSRLVRRVSGGLLFAAYLTLSGCGQPAAPPVTAKDVAAPVSAAAEPAKVAASREPVFKVGAEGFLKEFKADQKAANEKYKDKYVEIEGLVGEAPSTGFRNKMDIAVPEKREPQSGVQKQSVCCTMAPGAQGKLLELGRDQKVKVTGKVTLSIVDTVFLEDCTVGDVGPSTVIRTTAKELGAEFSKDDGEPAKQKYDSKDIWRPKELFVEGVVNDVVVASQTAPATNIGDVFVNLDAGENEPMICRMEPFWKEDGKQLKKGESVVLRGTFGTDTRNAKAYPMLWNAIVVKRSQPK